MRTTVDLDEELLKRAQAAVGATTKTDLLERGLRELIAKAARETLIASEGQLRDVKAVSRRRKPTR